MSAKDHYSTALDSNLEKSDFVQFKEKQPIQQNLTYWKEAGSLFSSFNRKPLCSRRKSSYVFLSDEINLKPSTTYKNLQAFLSSLRDEPEKISDKLKIENNEDKHGDETSPEPPNKTSLNDKLQRPKLISSRAAKTDKGGLKQSVGFKASTDGGTVVRRKEVSAFIAPSYKNGEARASPQAFTGA